MNRHEEIAKGLAKAFGEHGRPNTFTPGELAAAEYCNLSALAIGKVASNFLNMLDINRIMRERYHWKGSGVMYRRRRFAG